MCRALASCLSMMYWTGDGRVMQCDRNKLISNHYLYRPSPSAPVGWGTVPALHVTLHWVLARMRAPGRQPETPPALTTLAGNSRGSVQYWLRQPGGHFQLVDLASSTVAERSLRISSPLCAASRCSSSPAVDVTPAVMTAPNDSCMSRNI